jgi:hypothetical protein
MIYEPEKQGFLYIKIQMKVIKQTIMEGISKASGILTGTESCLV